MNIGGAAAEGGSNAGLEQETKGAYLAYAKAQRAPNRSVRLPAEGPIRFSGEGDHVTISMDAGAVTRNMQDNAAAFEGWSLALRHWCKAEKRDPHLDPGGRRDRHRCSPALREVLVSGHSV